MAAQYRGAALDNTQHFAGHSGDLYFFLYESGRLESGCFSVGNDGIRDRGLSEQLLFPEAVFIDEEHRNAEVFFQESSYSNPDWNRQAYPGKGNSSAAGGSAAKGAKKRR